MPLKKTHAISWWGILLFSVLSLFGLFLLFPNSLLLNDMMDEQHASPLTLMYLNDLIRRHPDRLDYKITLAKQSIQLGYISAAKRMVAHYLQEPMSASEQTQLQLLRYKINRIETFARHPNTPTRRQSETHLEQQIQALQNNPHLLANDAMLLGDDALALNHPALALNFYRQLFNRPTVLPVSFYARAGLAALFISDYQASTTFYLLAMSKSKSHTEKRTYLMRAVDSLNMSGASKHALNLAEQHMADFKHDKTMLIYLTQLAIRANQPKRAEEYISSVLKLHYKE